MASIAAVAFATGYFGDSASRFLPDERLFGDLWVRPYARVGCCGFVALDAGGRVVGYVIGARRPDRYRRELARLLLTRVLPGLVAQRYRHARPAARYLARVLRRRLPGADEARYPAHLHVNVLREARGAGLGRRLLERHLACLTASGVPGVHLSTTSENAAAIRLYERLGFATVRRTRSDLWRPWLGHDVDHLVMVKDLGRGGEA